MTVWCSDPMTVPEGVVCSRRDALAPLHRTDVGDDRAYLLFADALRWHRSEIPVVLLDAELSGHVERTVGVMIGRVDRIEERRSAVRPAQIGAVARGTGRAVQLLALSDEAGLPPIRMLRGARTPDEQSGERTNHRGRAA